MNLLGTIGTRAISALILLVPACAAAPGTQPHDMSKAQHEAMAQQEEQAADAHAQQHDPAAQETTTSCGRGGCWSSSSNPTAEHKADAEKHKELAAKHRAASAALAQAEARACVGIDEADRDMSPFNHREDIVSVSPLQDRVQLGKTVTSKTIGATVVFRARPGMTAEWLQRVVNCHLARGAAVGGEMPEMSYCPLMIKGAKASVTSAGDGFAVNVSADDDASAREILKRAQALKSS